MSGWRWPNARDWIGIGTFVLTVMILWMIKEDRTLREDEFFKTIATLIIGTGYVGGVVSWAYAATKGGGEQAESSARIAESVAGVATPVPADAAQAARQTADAADSKAEQIERNVT